MRSIATAPNVVRSACCIIAVLSAAACSRTASHDAPAAGSTPAVASDSPSHTPPVKEPPVTVPWSPVVDGLQIRAVPPPGPAKPGSTVTISLDFRNTGTELRRIYLLESEPFRAMQSTFFLALPTPTGLSMQPEPRPHGIVVTEVDFHELPPGQTRSFTQTLRLPADLAPGTVSVRWKYSNRVDRWKGGVQTLDGPTKELFGGERIPGIWVGEVEARFDVAVAEP